MVQTRRQSRVAEAPPATGDQPPTAIHRGLPGADSAFGSRRCATRPHLPSLAAPTPPLPPPPPAEGGWVRQPADQKPSFSVATLRKAVPKHCWERSLLRSSAYLAADLAMLAALVYASLFIDSAPVPPAVRWLALWPAYWFFAGAVATGVWVSWLGGGAGGGRAGATPVGGVLCWLVRSCPATRS